MGGVTPMGYVVKNRELVIEPVDAEGIRKTLYLLLMTESSTKILKILIRMGLLSTYGAIKQAAHDQKRSGHRWQSTG